MSQTSISVIIPVYNSIVSLEDCLRSVFASDYSNFEIILVDDGSSDGSLDVAVGFPVELLKLEDGPLGPANARNIGAQKARGEVLFFIDADVLVSPDTLTKIGSVLDRNPQFVAIFGSYDENPSDNSFLSQYKNLYHHFTHQQGQEEGATFWSGCGAIRREIFLEMRGFDSEKYPRPSIEDIDLGVRLKEMDYRILINKEIQVKHTKKWTLMGWIKTDVFDRAIPWTKLILEGRSLPNDLNLELSQRVSAPLVSLMLVYLIFALPLSSSLLLVLLFSLNLLLVSNWQTSEDKELLSLNRPSEMVSIVLVLISSGLTVLIDFSLILILLIFILLILATNHVVLNPSLITNRILFAFLVFCFIITYGLILISTSIWVAAVALVVTLVVIGLNFHLYAFFLRQRGLVFAIAALPFHFLYFVYSVISFGIGFGLYLWEKISQGKRLFPA